MLISGFLLWWLMVNFGKKKFDDYQKSNFPAIFVFYCADILQGASCLSGAPRRKGRCNAKGPTAYRCRYSKGGGISEPFSWKENQGDIQHKNHQNHVYRAATRGQAEIEGAAIFSGHCTCAAKQA